MNAPRFALCVILATSVALPASTSCIAVKQAAESAEDLAADSWMPVVGAILGSLAGPIGTILGGGLGGAYAVTRARLYAARDLAESLRKGQIYGRQQAIDLADSARGQKLDATPDEPELPWYRSVWAILGYIVLGVLTLRGAHHWRRAILGPNRVRTLAHIYLGVLCPLPDLAA